MRTKACTALMALLASLLLQSTVLLAQPHCRERRNVDSVDAVTIKALSDAIQKLKNENPDRYEFWKNVHGRSPEGPCDHSNNQLLPWHRAMLAYFEQELRRVSGDSCLALVYWNWTTDASGRQGYPKAFEDVFPDATRNDNSGMHQPAIAPGDITALLKLPWPDFSAGIQSPHGYIHVDYVGGNMTSPPTAARDFIFYGHHAELDRIFVQWQTMHSPDPGPPNKKFSTSGFPKPTSTDDVRDISKLGYSYDMLGGAQAEGLPEAPYPPAALALRGGTVTTFPVDIRQLKSDARLVLENVPVSSEFSEQGLVYVHPQNVPYESSPDFIRAYYAGYFFIWKRTDGDHPTHPATMDVVVDLSRRFNRLAAANTPKGKWVVTVVTSRVAETAAGRESIAGAALKFSAAAIRSEGGRTALKAKRGGGK
jgi:Common central domain of tyrosinase